MAASVGPYGAVLADGSEYRGRYGLTAAQLRDFHAPRLELLASAGPDLLAVETIPDIDEAEVLVDLLDDLGLATWFSFSARGGLTAAGQPLADAFATAAAPTTVAAVGRQLLPRGRGARRGPPGRGHHRQVGGRLPQRRRGVGRGITDLAGHPRRGCRPSPGSGWTPEPPTSGAAAGSDPRTSPGWRRTWTRADF